MENQTGDHPPPCAPKSTSTATPCAASNHSDTKRTPIYPQTKKMSTVEKDTVGKGTVEKDTVGTTNAATSSATSSRPGVAPTIPPAEKSIKFTGVNFKRWQEKMFFYLTTLSLQRFISENVPVMSGETPDDERFLVTEAWKHSDFLCNNYILSDLQDDLYNVYSNMKTSKKPWDALEMKYKIEDVGMKKFIVAKFLDYKMVDSKSVVTQVQELQVIIHNLLAEGLVVMILFKWLL